MTASSAAEPESPARSPLPDPAKVASVIASIRPAVQEDGGDIALVGVGDDGVVSIRFLGACVGCPSASVTLHQLIERALVEVPGVTGVTAVS